MDSQESPAQKDPWDCQEPPAFKVCLGIEGTQVTQASPAPWA